MSDLITRQQNNLPVTLDDLSKFVLIGNDKLQIVRAEISAIKKLGLAKEVHEQKLREGQDIAEMVTLAKMRMGALLNEIPKATTMNNPGGLKKELPQIETPVDLGSKENSDVESKQKNICTKNIEVEPPKSAPAEVQKEVSSVFQNRNRFRFLAKQK